MKEGAMSVIDKNIKNVKLSKAIFCWDCKKKLKEGDLCMPYDTSVGEFYKCVECHKKDSKLRNFRETEVYSRVCGYMRPISNWNKGKQQEHKDKKYFKI